MVGMFLMSGALFDAGRSQTRSVILGVANESRGVALVRSSWGAGRQIVRTLGGVAERLLKRSSIQGSNNAGLTGQMAAPAIACDGDSGAEISKANEWGVWVYCAGDYRNGAFLGETIGMSRDKLERLAERLNTERFGFRYEVRECGT